jgi:integral membrane protein (TIGR01906 family)
MMRWLMRWLIILAVPVVLIVLMVRLLTLPWFPAWEYSRVGFPEDAYGLQPSERLSLARACIAFLNLPHDIKILEMQRLPSGEPAFNERELEHMSDVKEVYDGITIAGALALVVAISAGWVLHRRDAPAAIWGGLSDGALLTLAALIMLSVFMLLAWNTFFTAFHGVFFDPGTWRFQYSDTLIRLFPMRFWRDAGLLVAGAVATVAFFLALVGRMLQKRLVAR